ncbi:uncharacterized protein PGTG_05465 [Puccinia graminis f. sp. tritici CRL 75-36-700-3]|uniref:Uncharacterized protein n=1 Tax=Puccinia graminis f. sp. tritici (strain CRL 75-36-700-3 / race SCCL) TaxID=418459 RepID=E3K4F8_PUCGT|nr:uncharacterized protein PGTG_05465 [Puccinia graminis f. sp. tritici CRL 75-36-700-3]EFP79144.1 hypothetical protein PGTG_05465 [Puccinia graminis f. sp. tritici CRL 75-36-700-3]
MSQTFTPSTKFSTNERDWQAEIGMLPWTTSIVFTKESLVRFLKTMDLEVDPNMSQLKKLPKFATCGVLSEGENNLQAQPPASTVSDAPSTDQADLPAFIPTRKVREQPGGGSSQIASLLGGNRENDAMNWVPPPISQHDPTTPVSSTHNDHHHQQEPVPQVEDDMPRVMMPDGSRFVPSRKVREPVGGHSSMADLLAGGR